MRFRIVARSLGVILASPLVALPGLAGQAPVAHETVTSDATFVGATPSTEGAQRGTPFVGDLSRTSSQRARPRSPEDSVVEVSITCGERGCVVQNGLEVTVVEGHL